MTLYQTLSQQLALLRESLPRQTTWKLLVGYSGGVDSHALLHCLVKLHRATPLDTQLQAIHIHHGLQPEADQWLLSAQSVCQQLKLTLFTQRVSIVAQPGASLEAQARTARYQAIANWVDNHTIFVTAHTKNDQAETVLLQLIRGAGLPGLSAMPSLKPFANGYHWRPLLATTRQQILTYANEAQLTWIEDKSNQDRRFARNYLRHEILPGILERWPAALTTIARSASHCATAQTLLDTLAKQDWQRVAIEQTHQLSVPAMMKLPIDRQINVLRYWCRLRAVTPPSEKRLNEIREQICHAREDKAPCVSWGQAVIRRYRNKLYLESSHTPTNDASLPTIHWQLHNNCHIQINTVSLTLSVAPNQTEGIRLSSRLFNQMVMVRFRQGGEKIRLAGKAHHQTLKQLWQAWGVPPWERSTIPLIYFKDQLILVVGYGVSHHFAAAPTEPGLVIQSNRVEPDRVDLISPQETGTA